MPLIQPAQPESYEPEPERGRRGRKALRYAVPVAVVGVTAATIGLVPALADSGDPSLPTLTAEQLIAKIAASDTQTVDGTVRFSTDLGLPSVLAGAAGSMFGGAAAPQGLGSQESSPADPQRQLVQLLVGSHTLHVAVDGPERQKISIIQPAAEYSLIHNGRQVWAYDSSSDEAYHATLPKAPAGAAQARKAAPEGFPATPQELARQVLAAARGAASITVDGTARVADHSAYELLVRPRHAPDTTIGAIRIAVDADTGVPLKLTVESTSGGKAVLDVAYTRVSFAEPAASTFTYKPGKGVKVTEGGAAEKNRTQEAAPQVGAPRFIGSGWDTVAVLKLPTRSSAGPLKPPPQGDGKSGANRPERPDMGAILGGFGKQVTGSFGKGTLFHTRLVNVLLTDDGRVYAGAVTASALTSAASAGSSA